MRAAAGLLVGVLILTGCSGGAGGGSGLWSRPELPDPLPDVTPSTALPFDSFKLSSSERALMQERTVALLTSCAAIYGVPVAFSGDYLRPADESRAQWGGLFGTESVEQAQEYGYHPAPTGDWAFVGGHYVKDPTNLRVQPSTESSEEERGLEEAVVYGPEDATIYPELVGLPEGGCWKEVEDRIDAPLVSFVDYEALLINMTVADDRFTAAQAEWSLCMTRAGYDFTSVDEPVASFALAELSTEEVQTAIADATCSQSTGWARIFYAILAGYQDQAIERDRTKFEQALSAERERFESLSRLQSR